MNNLEHWDQLQLEHWRQLKIDDLTTMSFNEWKIFSYKAQQLEGLIDGGLSFEEWNGGPLGKDRRGRFIPRSAFQDTTREVLADLATKSAPPAEEPVRVFHKILLHDINAFLKRTGMPQSAFGWATMCDPNLVRDLKVGRELRSSTKERIRRAMRTMDKEWLPRRRSPK